MSRNDAPRARRRRRIALLAAGLFAVLVVVLPLIADAIVPGMVADALDESLGLRAELDGCSMSWLGSSEVAGIRLSPREALTGEPLISAGEVRIDNSLLSLLLGSDLELVVDGLVVDATPDGDGRPGFLALAPPPEPETESAPPPELGRAVKITLLNGRLRTSRQDEAYSFGGVVTWSGDPRAPLDARLQLTHPDGSTVEASAGFTFDAGDGGWSAEAQVDVPQLSLMPLNGFLSASNAEPLARGRIERLQVKAQAAADGAILVRAGLVIPEAPAPAGVLTAARELDGSEIRADLVWKDDFLRIEELAVTSPRGSLQVSKGSTARVVGDAVATDLEVHARWNDAAGLAAVLRTQRLLAERLPEGFDLGGPLALDLTARGTWPPRPAGTNGGADLQANASLQLARFEGAGRTIEGLHFAGDLAGDQLDSTLRATVDGASVEIVAALTGMRELAPVGQVTWSGMAPLEVALDDGSIISGAFPGKGRIDFTKQGGTIAVTATSTLPALRVAMAGERPYEIAVPEGRLDLSASLERPEEALEATSGTLVVEDLRLEAGATALSLAGDGGFCVDLETLETSLRGLRLEIAPELVNAPLAAMAPDVPPLESPIVITLTGRVTSPDDLVLGTEIEQLRATLASVAVSKDLSATDLVIQASKRGGAVTLEDASVSLGGGRVALRGLFELAREGLAAPATLELEVQGVALDQVLQSKAEDELGVAGSLVAKARIEVDPRQGTSVILEDAAARDLRLRKPGRPELGLGDLRLGAKLGQDEGGRIRVQDGRLGIDGLAKIEVSSLALDGGDAAGKTFELGVSTLTIEPDRLPAILAWWTGEPASVRLSAPVRGRMTLSGALDDLAHTLTGNIRLETAGVGLPAEQTAQELRLVAVVDRGRITAGEEPLLFCRLGDGTLLARGNLAVPPAAGDELRLEIVDLPLKLDEQVGPENDQRALRTEAVVDGTFALKLTDASHAAGKLVLTGTQLARTLAGEAPFRPAGDLSVTATAGLSLDATGAPATLSVTDLVARLADLEARIDRLALDLAGQRLEASLAGFRTRDRQALTFLAMGRLPKDAVLPAEVVLEEGSLSTPMPPPEMLEDVMTKVALRLRGTATDATFAEQRILRFGFDVRLDPRTQDLLVRTSDLVIEGGQVELEDLRLSWDEIDRAYFLRAGVHAKKLPMTRKLANTLGILNPLYIPGDGARGKRLRGVVNLDLAPFEVELRPDSAEPWYSHTDAKGTVYIDGVALADTVFGGAARTLEGLNILPGWGMKFSIYRGVVRPDRRIEVPLPIGKIEVRGEGRLDGNVRFDVDFAPAGVDLPLIGKINAGKIRLQTITRNVFEEEAPAR